MSGKTYTFTAKRYTFARGNVSVYEYEQEIGQSEAAGDG
jgi:hypothetical protein